MFVYSLRASTVRFFCIVLLAAGIVGALAVFIPAYGATASETAATLRYDNVRTNEDRVAFIAQFGYTVEKEPIESVSFTVPEEFDRVLAGYNEIQRAQGLDLSRYCKKQVSRYTYSVKDYPDGTAVYINLIQYRDRIIAADLSSADPSGFVSGLALREE